MIEDGFQVVGDGPNPRRCAARALSGLFLAVLTGVIGLRRPRPATGGAAAGVNDQGERGLAFLVARSSWLRVNTVPAYQAIRHNYDHPEQRAELATNRTS